VCVCCSVCVLQCVCVAVCVCCSVCVLQCLCVACVKTDILTKSTCCSVLQCVAVCCSVLQCVAVCCSVPNFPMKNTHSHKICSLLYVMLKMTRDVTSETFDYRQQEAWHHLGSAGKGGPYGQGSPGATGLDLNMLQCEGCCSVLQYVAVCCSVLQCIVV